MMALDAVIEAVNAWGHSFCRYALTMFVQVSILVLLLLVFDLVLRTRSRISAYVRYGLWLLVLVKLVLPPSLALPTGIGYWVRPQIKVTPAVTSVVESESLPMEDSTMASYDSLTAGDRVPTVPVSTPIPSETARIALQWQGGLLLFWLAIVVCLLSLLIRRYWTLRREIRSIQPAPQAVTDCLQRCCAKLRLRSWVRVGLSKTLRSPVVCGFGRPLILLPDSLVQQLSTAAMEAVLGHELIHVRRRDPWIHLLQSLLQIVYFYHPLVWVANRITGRVRELAVDEEVLTTFKLKVSQYTDTLIGVAEMAYRKPILDGCLVGLAESREALEGRINHMLKQRHSDRARFGWIGGIVIVCFGVALVPMGQGRAKLNAAPLSVERVKDPARPADIIELIKLNPHEIPQALGKPQGIYCGETQYHSFDNLPSSYTLEYEKLSFLVDEDWVSEITIRDPDYDFGIFCEGVCVGVTEAEVKAGFNDEGTLKQTDSGDFLTFEELGVTFKIEKEARIVEEIIIACPRGDATMTMLRTKNGEFTRLLPQRIAQLDIDHDGLERVRELFGEPQKYGWGPKKTFDPNNLPARFVAWYPNGFQVCLYNDRIWEVRLEMTQSDYAYMGKIRIGSSLEEVLEVLGAPHEVVTGEELAFEPYVLYQDISDRKGYAYYHRPDHRVRLWFGSNKVAAIYLTNSEDAETEGDDPEFAKYLREYIDLIDIDKADLAEVKRIFGEPQAYVWGDEQFDANDLPERFIARYPSDFSVFMSGGQIVELRVSGKKSDYTFLDGIRVGASLDEVLAIMGEPNEVVQGEKNRFVDGVLYKDITGRRGYCYYHRSELHARLWFTGYRVNSIYLTRSDYFDGPSAKNFDEDFNRLLPDRIASLDIDTADRATVEAVFGKPLRYLWGNRKFTVDQLPENYILSYPCSFNVWISGDRIKEIRHGRGSKYVFAPGVELGASVEAVLAVLGDPSETVIGEENKCEPYILYRDIDGDEGHCYYHRPDKQVRVWFADNELIAIYMTRSDF